ncbi:AAA family ATPase [Alistipes sp.]|uniref:AAA family ATPase n=1 Tax=Alistipes sp. TaxID=1872444 RepID=UPI003AB6B3EC
MRAYSPTEIENLNIPELPLDGEWEAVFGRPSRYDRWFIDGESASGKSTFVMLLAKKLCEYGRVDYVSLEEGANLSFKNRIKRLRMKDKAGSFKVVTNVTVAEIIERLAKPKSANFIVIDSVQYLDVRSFERLKKTLLDRFPHKGFILVSQVYKGRPKGKLADDLRFDCGVKIHTRGYRAYCQGRFADDTSVYFTIWEEGAYKYYLNK